MVWMVWTIGTERTVGNIWMVGVERDIGLVRMERRIRTVWHLGMEWTGYFRMERLVWNIGAVRLKRMVWTRD